MTAASIQRASCWVPCSAGAAESSPKMALVTAEPAAIRQRGSTPGRPPAGEKLAIADRMAGSGTAHSPSAVTVNASRASLPSVGGDLEHAVAQTDTRLASSTSNESRHPRHPSLSEMVTDASTLTLLRSCQRPPTAQPDYQGPPGSRALPGGPGHPCHIPGSSRLRGLAVCSRDFGGNQAESCTSRRRHHLKRRSSTAETVSRTSGQPTRHEGDSQNDPGQHARPLSA